MATINLTNVISNTRPTGGGAVQFDKPVGSNLTAEQARTLLTSIRAQITAGGTVQTGYLSLQRADNGEFTIENRSRFNAFGNKDGAASLVKDLIMPPIGLLLGKVDFSNLFVTLREGAVPGPYASVEVAQKAGAVTFNYGLFINTCISFVIIAFAVFLLIRAINRLKAQEAAAPAAPPPTPEDVLLLREIRDALKK